MACTIHSQLDSKVYFLTARDLAANIARALKVSTCKQTWRLDTIAQHEKI